MKSAAQLGLVTGVAAVAGFGHWIADGRPSGMPVRDFEERAESKRPLKEGEIKLETIEAEGEEGVLWVDARTEEKWRADGLEGSIHITRLSNEGIGTQLARHQDRLFDARMMVIYCDGLDCELSHELAERLRNEFAGLVPEEIRVLYGGHVALRAAGRIKDSSPGS